MTNWPTHTLRLFFTHFTEKKGHKGWRSRKMPEVRIKLDKMLKDKPSFQILLHDFMKNLALKQCDPYMVTLLGVRINLVSSHSKLDM